MKTTIIALAALAAAGSAQAAEITRVYDNPKSIIANVVRVPAGSELIFVSGQLPSTTGPGAAAGTMPVGTQAQAESVFARIEGILKAQGLTMGDVVSMTVYLAGDPAKEGKMDFGGMMAAYNKYFGTAAQPNRPSRSTVQVAALVLPTALVEIEVTAAKAPR